MAPPKSEGQVLLREAEKKREAASSSSFGFKWFSSPNDKFEEAAELFQRAANSFKLERSFVDAGDAFSKEAECRERCELSNDAANAWWNAAKAYKQADQPDLAIEALNQTVTFMTKSGRFRQAADRMKDIAQIHLQRGDIARACQSFEQAGEWYQQEDANAMANGCFKDAADLHAQIDEFGPAILRYEQVAEQSLQSNLTKFSVKEYWLRSGLCALANTDSVTAKRNLDKYGALDPGFLMTREAKFLSTLIEVVESGDTQAFANACRDYDQVMKLDNWKTTILLKIKKTIDEEPALT